MRLIYITNSGLPSQKAQGVQIMKACEAFVREGLDVTLVTARKRTTGKTNVFSYYKITEKFKFKRLPSLDLLWVSFIPQRLSFYIQTITFGLFSFFYLITRARSKDSIFYSRDFPTLFLLCCLGLKPIAEIHDYRYKQPKRFIQFVLSRVRCIVVNSAGSEELLRKYYHIPCRLLVIPNGVDTSFFNIKENRIEARKILNIPEDKIVISYIGSLETAGMDKGVGSLLEAFALLGNDKDALLYIVGGPYDSTVKLRKKAEHLNLPVGKVFFVDHVDYARIPTWLRAFDISVIPLPRSGHSVTTSPLKLFEFMAAGLPVIVSDIPALRSIVNESQAVFYVPEDSSSLAEKINILKNDSVMRDHLSKALKERAEEFIWEKRARRIINFINYA